MYVIGISEHDLIKICFNTYYNREGLHKGIETIKYDVPIDKATIISDYDEVKQTLEEIQSNIEDIYFSSYDMIQDIIDKNDFNKNDFNKNDFNKINYSRDLKIFKLMPVKVIE